MKTIGLVGFDERICALATSSNYKIVDANHMFSSIEKLDRAQINLRNLSIKLDLDEIDIDTYWRFKGEFDHYSNRREIPLSHEEQDLLFRYILSLSIKFIESVDLIVFSNLPHQGADSIINNCAKLMGLKTIFFNPSIFKNYCYLINGEERNFQNMVVNNLSTDDMDVEGFNTSEKQKHYYMEKYYFLSRSTLATKVTTFLDIIKCEPSYPIRLLIKRFFNKYMHRKYRKIPWKKEISFDGSKINIYFPLHLQPELTTSNLGGIYFDQNYTISRLIKYCDSKNFDYRLYLKENPKQKQTFRTYLNQFSENEKVVFVDKAYPSDKLVTTCDITCTIAGTAGWEAIKSGKKCLFFGSTWYETAPGAISKLDELEAALKAPDISPDEVSEWYNDHKKYLHYMQNDDSIPEMPNSIEQTAHSLKNVLCGLD